jgi:hypothetical protein
MPHCGRHRPTARWRQSLRAARRALRRDDRPLTDRLQFYPSVAYWPESTPSLTCPTEPDPQMIGSYLLNS